MTQHPRLLTRPKEEEQGRKQGYSNPWACVTQGSSNVSRPVSPILKTPRVLAPSQVLHQQPNRGQNRTPPNWQRNPTNSTLSPCAASKKCVSRWWVYIYLRSAEDIDPKDPGEKEKRIKGNLGTIHTHIEIRLHVFREQLRSF